MTTLRKIAPRISPLAGAAFEREAQIALSKLNFELDHSGKTGDGGIDLFGKWNLESQIDKPKVIVQCKGGDRRTPVNVVREFMGTLQQRPNTLGLLVSRVGFTTASHDLLLSSSHAGSG